MELTALCVQIFMNVFVLLSTQACLSYTVQKHAFPIISPDRLQFFEYESLSVNCGEDEDMNAWRVMRKLHQMSPANVSEACSNPAPSCTIHHTFERHSGEYWCENDEGERSHVLNISVTAGEVILNISAQPVKEGSDVTLRCINKNTEKAYNSDFYKDESHQGTYYETDMTLSKVSKSDEGLYKCSISGAGESPESWLAVVTPIEEEGSNEKMQPLTHLVLILIILLCTIFTLLFLVILYKKHKAMKNEIVTDPKDTTYASINKTRKRNAGGDTANEPEDVTYAAVQIKKKGSNVSKYTTEQHASEQESTYSVIALKKGNITLEFDCPPLLASPTRAVNQLV